MVCLPGFELHSAPPTFISDTTQARLRSSAHVNDNQNCSWQFNVSTSRLSSCCKGIQTPTGSEHFLLERQLDQIGSLLIVCSSGKGHQSICGPLSTCCLVSPRVLLAHRPNIVAAAQHEAYRSLSKPGQQPQAAGCTQAESEPACLGTRKRAVSVLEPSRPQLTAEDSSRHQQHCQCDLQQAPSISAMSRSFCTSSCTAFDC